MATGISKRRKKAKLTAAAMENLPGMHSLGAGSTKNKQQDPKQELMASMNMIESELVRLILSE